MLDLIYRFSKQFFLTADLTRRIEGRMAILYPLDEEGVARKSGKQLVKLYLIAIALGVLMIMFAEVSLYYVIVVCITVYSIVSSYIYRGFDKLELKLLEEMLKFIESVKFRFQFDGMLEEAILDAITDSDEEMAVHGQLIYDHLRESYIKDRCDYGEVSPHQFFLTFYSLCEAVMKYGDKKDDNGSLFIKNLGYLKEDIGLEILKKKAVRGQFMGLGPMCVIPAFCIKPIEMWATYNMPELAGEYDSVMGRIITIVLALICVLVYKLVQSLEYPGRAFPVRRKWVRNLMKNTVVSRLHTAYMNSHLDKLKNIEKLLKQVSYPYNIAEFCVKRTVTSIWVGTMALVILLAIGCGWYSVPIALVVAAIYYNGLVLYIRAKRQLMAMEQEDEIIRFQGIILMLMHSDRISIDQILSQMERFARNFKSQLEEISDKLSYQGMAVFKQVKERTDFLPFNRLLDGFIACDDMYIHQAFEDVELDRRYYIEKHKQDNALYTEQRGAMAKFLSYIPLCAVVIVKLVIPFVMEGMSQMAVSGMGL